MGNVRSICVGERHPLRWSHGLNSHFFSGFSQNRAFTRIRICGIQFTVSCIGTLASGVRLNSGFPFLSFWSKDPAPYLVRRLAFAYPVRWTGNKS